MKKSQLRKLIRESIKELMTEHTTQQGGIPGHTHTGNPYNPLCAKITATPCSNTPSPMNQAAHQCVTLNGAQPHVGDVFSYPNQFPGVRFEVTSISPPTSTTTQDFNKETNCGTTQSGSCNPSAWSNHANWTTTFTSTVTNHNNPCQFLNNKIAQWTAALQGTGGGNFQNMLNCKLDTANQLHTSNNC